MQPSPLHIEREVAKAHADARDYSAMLDLVSIDRELVRRGGLKEFTQLAWPVIQPGARRSLKWNWHLDAVCDHFDAFFRGHITRLLVNIPPRHTKSTIGSVSAPVWAWTIDPSIRMLTCSYRDMLSTRDARRSRLLIKSPWFQERWGDMFSLAKDQDQKTQYENNRGGFRLSQSVGGGSTGEGGDLIIVDDPHSTRRAESDKDRQNTLDWWDDEMQSRLDDQESGGLAIIMQRLHEQDLSGHVLEQDVGYVHLCLPTRYEPERKCTTTFPATTGMPGGKEVVGRKVFTDPRTTEGEPLDNSRFPEKVIEDKEKRMSPYAFAGQELQKPAPRKGAMFDVDLIEVVGAVPNHINAAIRYWDKAGTDAKKARSRGAFTAGAKMGRITRGTHKGKFIILDMVRKQWSVGKREEAIKNTAINDGVIVKIGVEQEPGSGGMESAQNTISNLAGFVAEADRPTGDKVLRAEPFAAQMDVGNIIMLKGEWNEALKHELRMFPVGAQKDQVDALSAAFNLLSKGHTGGYTW